MAANSAYRRRCLDAQGFVDLDDEAKATLDLPLRFTPALCMAATVVGVLLHSPVIVGTLAATAAASLVGSQGHVFDVLYNHGVRRLTGGPRLPRNPAPRRLAFLMATVMLTATAVAFAVGLRTLGSVLGTVQIVGCATYVFTGFCIGSWLHGKLFGPVPAAQPAPRAADAA